MTTRSNLYVDQGLDFYTSLALFDGEEDEFEVTDYTFKASARKLYSSSSVSLDMIVSIIAGPPPNDVDIRIPGSATVNLTPGKYNYDLIMMNAADNKTQKILEGLLIVIPTMTRPD